MKSLQVRDTIIQLLHLVLREMFWKSQMVLPYTPYQAEISQEDEY